MSEIVRETCGNEKCVWTLWEDDKPGQHYMSLTCMGCNAAIWNVAGNKDEMREQQLTHIRLRRQENIKQRQYLNTLINHGDSECSEVL